jgi:hypothetical protein
MSEVTAAPAIAQEQNMAMLNQIGLISQQNFVTFGKLAELRYLAGQGMVDLEEALGGREVSSEKNPGGPSKPGTN